mmetsp:Transcript_55585/g.148200  ORF Transcript_55585/g.148200 Transcript_55585/m.148200 type:complete len:234 (-) Transcript_55585:1155-1856(-)
MCWMLFNVLLNSTKFAFALAAASIAAYSKTFCTTTAVMMFSITILVQKMNKIHTMAGIPVKPVAAFAWRATSGHPSMVTSWKYVNMARGTEPQASSINATYCTGTKTSRITLRVITAKEKRTTRNNSNIQTKSRTVAKIPWTSRNNPLKCFRNLATRARRRSFTRRNIRKTTRSLPTPASLPEFIHLTQASASPVPTRTPSKIHHRSLNTCLPSVHTRRSNSNVKMPRNTSSM